MCPAQLVSESRCDQSICNGACGPIQDEIGLLTVWEWGVVTQVCDFNLSRVMEETAVLSSMAATNPRWLAPEILAGRGYTFSSDIYSFGIILWEFLTWRVPWHEYGPWQVRQAATGTATPPPSVSAASTWRARVPYMSRSQHGSAWRQHQILSGCLCG